MEERSRVGLTSPEEVGYEKEREEILKRVGDNGRVVSLIRDEDDVPES